MQHYLQIVEGAASLSTYPDSQFVALLELLSECGRVRQGVGGGGGRRGLWVCEWGG